ncbi:hypothetical protein BWQ96_06314 [Gracilariopsis chorda]|uniref:Uncharacterized protein n=1 Tax=Gracilariopsis chorda TaxID=448386 RepID=A0A2V3IPD0_9FLOR|nr:hypothetical protein BWQ96_06314 [Gracilariopsis chorda]|eukprot:PXF43945.1 hypothetical protein BWQ96_06314 [Gracilariopsis chorda]
MNVRLSCLSAEGKRTYLMYLVFALNYEDTDCPVSNFVTQYIPNNSGESLAVRSHFRGEVGCTRRTSSGYRALSGKRITSSRSSIDNKRVRSSLSELGSSMNKFNETEERSLLLQERIFETQERRREERRQAREFSTQGLQHASQSMIQNANRLMELTKTMNEAFETYVEAVDAQKDKSHVDVLHRVYLATIASLEEMLNEVEDKKREYRAPLK